MVPTGGPLPEALAFYTQQLGFSIDWEGGNMAGVSRDQVRFNLVENSSKEWLDNCSISIGVSDLDALYEEYRQTSSRINPPKVQPWGRREFHMIIPSGVCLQFYDQNA